MCNDGNCGCNCGCEPRQLTTKEKIEILEEKKAWLEEKTKYISKAISDLKKEKKKK